MNVYKMLTANTPITARDVKIRGATRGNAESGRSSGEKLISATNIPQAHGHKTPWTLTRLVKVLWFKGYVIA